MNTDEYIKVLFAVEGPSGPDVESVWAKPHPRGFEILNIPFYALSIALGDIVATEVGEGRAHWFRSLVHASGHSTDPDRHL